MSNDTGPAEAAQRYATAHAVHYTAKDLHTALEFYQGIQADFPDSKEAGFAGVQIHNIVRAVVPSQVLLEAQADLALSYFEESNGERKVVALASASRVLAAVPGSGKQ